MCAPENDNSGRPLTVFTKTLQIIADYLQGFPIDMRSLFPLPSFTSCFPAAGLWQEHANELRLDGRNSADRHQEVPLSSVRPLRSRQSRRNRCRAGAWSRLLRQHGVSTAGRERDARKGARREEDTGMGAVGCF